MGVCKRWRDLATSLWEKKLLLVQAPLNKTDSEVLSKSIFQKILIYKSSLEDANLIFSSPIIQHLEIIGFRGQAVLYNENLYENLSALTHNYTLKTLILSHFKFGYLITRRLAEIFKVNRSIKKLVVNNCQIGNGGHEDIANIVFRSRSLQYIELRDDGIGKKGGKALTQALRSNSTLTSLNVRGNNIGETETYNLLEAIVDSQTLKQASLSYYNPNNKGFFDAFEQRYPWVRLYCGS